MVLLSLHPTKGNGGGRAWSHTGYLGLTKIAIDGIVRTRVDDDQRLLQASSITISVRCYESRIRFGSVRSNILVDATQTLWSKPESSLWGFVGDLDLPFKVVLPAKVAGFSTANFQDYRVFWRIEATLNHIPMIGLGSRQIRHFDLNLIRHNITFPTSIGPAIQTHSETSNPHLPTIRYRMVTPSFAVGPGDPICVSVKFQLIDRTTTIQAMCVILERRIELRETTAECLHAEDLAAPGRLPTLNPSTASLASASSSTVNLTPTERKRSQSPSGGVMPSRTIITPLISTEVTNVIADSDGIYYHTATLNLPLPKSTGHWAIGETMRTDLAVVRFFVRVKIYVPASFGMTESVELDERELFVVSTSEEERRTALQKIHERPAKSPRPELPNFQSSPPLPSLPPTSSKTVPRRPQTAGSSSSSRASRRPQAGRPHSTGEPITAQIPPLEASIELVKAWEEELERIARRSRRKSLVMPNSLGGKRSKQRRDDKKDNNRQPTPTPSSLQVLFTAQA